MTVSPAERVKARAAAVASALRNARKRRSNISIRELARRSGVSPSTLSRLENPDRQDSPQVETLEALAAALDTPLYELLGESVTVEYHAGADWPSALTEVLAERGGLVSSVERLFIEQRLAALRDAGSDQVDDANLWRQALAQVRDRPLWRLVDVLVTDGWGIADRSLQALLDIVREMRASKQRIDGPGQVKTAKQKPRTKARRKRTKKGRK